MIDDTMVIVFVVVFVIAFILVVLIVGGWRSGDLVIQFILLFLTALFQS